VNISQYWFVSQESLSSGDAKIERVSLQLSAENYEKKLQDVRELFKRPANYALLPAHTTPTAVFFDMDATLIAEESLVAMATLCGKGEEVARVTAAAMGGAMDFATSLHRRLSLIAGAPAKVLDEVLDTMTLHPGAVEFCGALKARGIPMFLISGGFTQLAGPIAAKLGFAGYAANELEIKDGQLTGLVVGPVVDAEAKTNFVVQTLAKLNLTDPSRAVAIGDGANDAGMMSQVGIAVGYQAKPVLHRALNANLGAGDFRFLLQCFDL
jgi:phosphoserine phosphatase